MDTATFTSQRISYIQVQLKLLRVDLETRCSSALEQKKNSGKSHVYVITGDRCRLSCHWSSWIALLKPQKKKKAVQFMINRAENKYKIPFHNTWVRLHETKSHI